MIDGGREISMKERVGLTPEELDEMNRYAPFSHATTKENAKNIDKHGLLPRKETGSGGVYPGFLQSMDDRIYFASARDGGYHSINALRQSFNNDMKMVRENGVIYLLKFIPLDLAPFIVLDEDCIEEAERKNDEIISEHEEEENEEWKEDLWDCDDGLDSINLVGTFAIKHSIPRNLLLKMSVDDFCNKYVC